MPEHFVPIKEYVLGKKYDLSFAYLSPAKMRAVALATKKKDVASNVLAFPLSPTSGEILICPATARREAKSFGMDAETFCTYLFIHGLLHIKGRRHGATMESEEHRIMKRFGVVVHEAPRRRRN